MISYKEAQDILIMHAHSFGLEHIPLDAAFGRVLAAPVMAEGDYPPFNRSTMDGYAIRYADWQEGILRFSVVETLYAGSVHTQAIGAGQCYKIMTGAPVPEYADMVIRREDTEEGEGMMEIRMEAEGKNNVGDNKKNWRPFLNIARQGEDLRSGDTAVGKGCYCDPAVIGLLASLGKQEVPVEKLPRVAVLTTGNEVVGVDAAIRPGQIRNSNQWLLRAVLEEWKITPSFMAHLPDQRDILLATLADALSFDMIILSGGVSAGDADYVPGVLEELGVQKLFHKMAIKPGKPTWCGITKGGGMVFALPGNPFSCLVNSAILLLPWISACFGLPVPQPLGLPLQVARKKKTPLDEFFPVRISGSPAGAAPLALSGSGDIRLGGKANALALHPADSRDLEEGTLVLCYPLTGCF